MPSTSVALSISALHPKMNSTINDHLQQFLTSVSESRYYFPIMILAMAIGVFMFVKANGRMSRLYRLLFRFTIDHDSSTRSVSSPNNQGQFRPPIWCRTCNDHIDHVENMCPHIGRKLHASSHKRFLYEMWRRQQLIKYKTVNRLPAAKPEVPNVTIDLDEVLGHGIDRKMSFASISSIPCQASTPEDNRSQQRMQRQQSRLDGHRSWANRRRASSESSGIGSSIGSIEDERPQVRVARFIEQMAKKPRRWVSDLTGVPKIAIHPCSTSRRPVIPITPDKVFESATSNNFLRVNVSWNGPNSATDHIVHGFRRASCHPGDEPETVKGGIQRSFSMGANHMHLPVFAHPQQPYFDEPILVHASANGEKIQVSSSAAAMAG